MSDAVLAAITGLAERFGRMEARLERLESGQDALKSELATVKSAQERFQHDLDRRREGVLERIDRLQSQVATLREDVPASFKASEQR